MAPDPGTAAAAAAAAAVRLPFAAAASDVSNSGGGPPLQQQQPPPQLLPVPHLQPLKEQQQVMVAAQQQVQKQQLNSMSGAYYLSESAAPASAAVGSCGEGEGVISQSEGAISCAARAAGMPAGQSATDSASAAAPASSSPPPVGSSSSSQSLEAAAAVRLKALDLESLAALLRRYSRDPRVHRLLRLPASSAAALAAYRGAAETLQRRGGSGSAAVLPPAAAPFSAAGGEAGAAAGGGGGEGAAAACGGSSSALVAASAAAGGGAGGGSSLPVSAAAGGLRREMLQLYSSVDALLTLYERQALQLYSRSRPQMLLLQQELQATDSVLQRLETRLLSVRDELRQTSANIGAVEERSFLLGRRMGNREETSIVLNAFLQQITLEPKLVQAICHARLGRAPPPSVAAASAAAANSAARVASPAGGPARAAGGGGAAAAAAGAAAAVSGGGAAAAAGAPAAAPPLDHAAFVAALQQLNKKIEHAKQPGMQRLKCAATSLPELQKLLACALSRISAYLSAKLSLLRQPRTNVFILQQNDLLRCADLYAFLLDHEPSTAFAFKNLYTRTIAQVYVNLFRVYIHQLRRLQQQQQLPLPPPLPFPPSAHLHQQQQNAAASLGVAGAAAAAVAAAASLLPGGGGSGASAAAAAETNAAAGPHQPLEPRASRKSPRNHAGEGGAAGASAAAGPSSSVEAAGGGAAGAAAAAGTSFIASAKQVVGFLSKLNTSGPTPPLPFFSAAAAPPLKSSTFCLGERHLILSHLDDDPVIATPWPTAAAAARFASHPQRGSAAAAGFMSSSSTAAGGGGGKGGGGAAGGNFLAAHTRVLPQQLPNVLPEEQVFRSHQKLLLDTATREFLFLTQFFLDAGLDCPYSRLFHEALSSSMAFLMGVIENAVRGSSDAVGLLLMLRINHHNRLTMRRRKLSCLNAYLAQVRELLHASLRDAMEAAILSLQRTSPQAAMEELSAEVRFQPHCITRQFAELVSALEYVRLLPLLTEQRMQSPQAPQQQPQQQQPQQHRPAAEAEAAEDVEAEDYHDPALLKALVDAALNWIYRMAELFPSRRERAIFLVNNYDLLLHVFHQRNVLPDVCAAVEKHLYEQISIYVEEQQQRHFGRLIAAVAAVELANKPQLHTTEASSSTALPQLAVAAPLLPSVLAELEAAATEFTAEWKQRLSATQAESLAVFSTFPNSVEILKQSMTQLLLLHARLEQAIAAAYASAKTVPSWTKHIVPVNSILSEIRAISRNLA